MKKILVFLLPVLALSATLQLGGDLLFRGDFLRFDDVVRITYFISDMLEYDPPMISRNATFSVLIFNGASILFSRGKMAVNGGTPERETMSLEEFLRVFSIPFFRRGRDFIIPDCQILSLKRVGMSLRVNYYGTPKFSYVQKAGYVSLVSKGYVLYAGEVYPPGSEILSVPTPALKIGSVVESRGADLVKLIKPGEERKILVVNVGEKMDPLPQDSFAIVVARGEGVILIRPPSPDLSGLDEKSFENSLEVGLLVSKKLGYRLEKVPVASIPPGTSGMMVLLRERDDLIKIIDTIRRLTGIEKVVDRSSDFDTLPDLGK